MKIAIQQPHYFPWLGFFDKIQQVDLFVLMDEVQLVKRSNMIRNRILSTNGSINYISIQADTKSHREKQYNEILTQNDADWKGEQLNYISAYYRKSEYFKEVYPIIEDFLNNNSYKTLNEWCCNSIFLCCELLGIDTKFTYQSALEYDRQAKKNELILELCKAAKADVYLAGRGASLEYLNVEQFNQNNIQIEFQDFEHPTYTQLNSAEFVKGLSIIDVLFNCGVKNTKSMFWQAVGKADKA